MSLTSFLYRNQDVRQQFRQEFTKPRMSAINRQKMLLAPPLTNNYAVVGTAFDYLLRFQLQHINPFSIHKGYWIAEHSVSLLSDDKTLFKKGNKIISTAQKRVSQFLKSGQFNDGLVESALCLAQLDAIFRAGRGHDQIGKINRDDLKDLHNLISIVPVDMFKAQNLCLLNPTFGPASVLVGGADADFVIDDMLIDLKTTKHLQLLERYFHQLIGYYILHTISGVGEIKPKITINKIGIYFSRHAHLEVIDINKVVKPTSYASFVGWFQRRVQQTYGE